MKESVHWEKPNRDGIIKFKSIFKELFGSVRTGLIWLRTVTQRRFLWKRWWTSWFYKIWGLSWL